MSTSVATEITTGRRTKNKICKTRVWSRHRSLFWKIMEKPEKIKQGLRKNQILGPEVGYVWERY